METIGSGELWSFIDGRDSPNTLTNGEVRRNAAVRVDSYVDLATKVAELQFRNRNHVLMFRGQTGDHKNRAGRTSLQPGINRPRRDAKGRRLALKDAEIARRFEQLAEAEARLVKAYESSAFIGKENLRRQRVLRWAIIQHYELCPTPLLDITNSLRVAASFASLDNEDEAFIFVLGLPNVSGAITASAEAGLQIVRLSSVCPPQALRPHIQEGYLLGNFPELANVEQRADYASYEIDFGRRLIAKFRFDPKTFWNSSAAFPRVPREALYPEAGDDPLLELVKSIPVAMGLPASPNVGSP